MCVLMWTHFEECTMIFSLVMRAEICQLLCFPGWSRTNSFHVCFMCKSYSSIFGFPFFNIISKWEMWIEGKVKTSFWFHFSWKWKTSYFHLGYCDDKREHNCSSLHINIAFVRKTFNPCFHPCCSTPSFENTHFSFHAEFRSAYFPQLQIFFIPALTCNRYRRRQRKFCASRVVKSRCVGGSKKRAFVNVERVEDMVQTM